MVSGPRREEESGSSGFKGIARLLTKREVAEILSVSPSTVSRYVKQGWIPYVKVDGNKVNKKGHISNCIIRFRRKDVEKFIQENLVPSKDELLDKLGI